MCVSESKVIKLHNAYGIFFEIHNYAKLSERSRFIHIFSKNIKKNVLDLFINQNVLGPTDFQTYFGVTMGYVRS